MAQQVGAEVWVAGAGSRNLNEPREKEKFSKDSSVAFRTATMRDIFSSTEALVFLTALRVLVLRDCGQGLVRIVCVSSFSYK